MCAVWVARSPLIPSARLARKRAQDFQGLSGIRIVGFELPVFKERYLVHIVNFSPLRHTPSHPDYCEDSIALTDVTVRVNLPIHASTAQAVVAGATLPAKRTQAGGVEFTVPRVPIHEVVSLEVA
jgi:hypothetical protein